MKTALIIAFTDLGMDSRVSRQIEFLKDNFRVIAAGIAPPTDTTIEFIELSRRRKGPLEYLLAGCRIATKRFDSYYWGRTMVVDALSKLKGIQADVVIANDTETLPLAVAVAPHPKAVCFDAHEYAPLEGAGLVWSHVLQPYQLSICKKYMPMVGATMTVCDGIADLYLQDTGTRPVVLTNAIKHSTVEVQACGDVIKLVHQGIASSARKLENMIEMMEHLDERFRLDLVLLETQDFYLQELKDRAAKDDRITFSPPVAMSELPTFLSSFDIGLCIVPPTNVNYQFGLPNKFFEWIQGRLAIVVGPTPEMARLVREHGLGLVTDSFEPQDVAKHLSQLDPAAVNRFKNSADRAAKILNAESNKTMFIELVGSCLHPRK